MTGKCNLQSAGGRQTVRNVRNCRKPVRKGGEKVIQRKRIVKGACMLEKLPDVTMAIMDICMGTDTEVKVEDISAWKDGKDIVVRITDCMPCECESTHMSTNEDARILQRMFRAAGIK